MANVYPSATTGLFCTWLLNNSLIRLTAPRKIQVQNVLTASNTGGYVAQLYMEEFVQYTERFYVQWQQYANGIGANPQPSTYDALTIAWLANVTTPSQATIYAIDAFFKQLRADGNLLLDYFYLFAQDNQSNAKKSIINSGLYAVTEHNTPTWNAYLGYTGNGTNSYLSSNYIDSANAVNYAVNNAMFGVYTRNVVTPANKVCIGNFDGTRYNYLYSNFTGSITDVRCNGGVDVTGSNAVTQGLIVVERTSSTVVNCAKNAIIVVTGSATSSGLSTQNDYIMAFNNNGTAGEYDTNQYTCAFKGSASINQTLFNSAVNLLMDNLGAHY